MENRAFLPYRGSRIPLKQGVPALIAAVGSAILCLGMGLLLIVNLGLEGSCGCVTPSPLSQVWQLLEMAGAVGGAAIPLGFVTWQFLGLIGRERAITYSIAGLIEGLACATLIVYVVAGGVQPKQLPAFLVLGTLGAGIGLAFWRFARSPKGTG
jgi:hypothetical protein